MACTWSAPSHYLNQSWNIIYWTFRNKHQWIFDQNSNIFIQENAFENVVCEMAVILPRPQCVNMGGILIYVLILKCFDMCLSILQTFNDGQMSLYLVFMSQYQVFMHLIRSCINWWEWIWQSIAWKFWPGSSLSSSWNASTLKPWSIPTITHYIWNHDMEILCILLILYEGKVSVTGGFPSQSAGDVEL